MKKDYPAGLYLLNYDGFDPITAYEIVTVNSTGLVEISESERAWSPREGDTLTPLVLAPVPDDSGVADD